MLLRLQTLDTEQYDIFSKPSYNDKQFKWRFRCTQPLRSKYAIIIFIYIATTLPPQLLPVRLKKTYRTHSPKLRLLLVVVLTNLNLNDGYNERSPIPKKIS